MNPLPITLTGKLVRLEPLVYGHAPDLLSAAMFDEIWTYLDEPTPRTTTDITRLVDDALHEQGLGQRLPFAIIDQADGHAVGSASYIDIRPQDRGVEIGWLWLTPSRWGTGMNTEAMFLLLEHAFTKLHAVRVALKTDERNVRSQRAIEALGAVREGVWRNHRILSTGVLRNSVFYSVIEAEHHATLTRLATKLALIIGQGPELGTNFVEGP